MELNIDKLGLLSLIRMIYQINDNCIIDQGFDLCRQSMSILFSPTSALSNLLLDQLFVTIRAVKKVSNEKQLTGWQ